MAIKRLTLPRLLAFGLLAATLAGTAMPGRSAEPEPADAPTGTLARLQQLTQRAGDTLAVSKLQELGHHASDLALAAIDMIGINYKRGGNTPANGLDCSGLVRYVFLQSWGAVLPRTAAEISKVGQKVKTQDLQPGDLVFYNTLRRGFSHVGIYLGDNKFIHSPSAGGQVRIESMDLAYWKKRFNGARRIEDPQQKEALIKGSSE